MLWQRRPRRSAAACHRRSVAELKETEGRNLLEDEEFALSRARHSRYRIFQHLTLTP